ncbi:phage shock protein operon transcriptional activator [Vibrio sp. S11_S32]|uniref:phage shock protein operon transcriptional activator n=1 Tax=Vibrio sp. S11_S32 TaxID=2720225 RepID=UPI0016813023|nr:phage shock protein operon transcriptional activator [Vibrio sp. S11_S32]MBD1576708.1 phage shock protein operon transcriptional activator [Vibrio sp. S11_S32]
MKVQNLIGQSSNFLALLDKTSQLAAIKRPVLIVGERGTGKELIAQRLHYLSKRWRQPLITLNCSTFTDGLIDSELFGHESGAFTGAKNQHKGRFERAELGTLFLDELATAPMSVQEKLLRVIEYGEYERVGGSKMLSADVRVICATNSDLPQLAAKGEFRADLLDRLAFDVLTLPPLRERIEDILLLAEHFAIQMCQELGFEMFAGFSTQAQQELLSYSWPGNVRELKNVVERAVYRHGLSSAVITQIEFNPFAKSDTVTNNVSNNTAEMEITGDSHPAVELNHIELPINYKQWQAQQDCDLLQSALQQAKYNQRHAADLLGLSYHQLRGMLKKYNISPKSH